MTARRLFNATALFLTAALAVSACSSDSGDDPAAEPSTPAGDSDTSLADVQEAGVLVVGTEGTYRPFSYHEDGSGDLTGYDVEVARAVGEELGVEVQFQETQWDAIFAGLEAGRFDVIANQVSITPEREGAYTFSEPYTYSPGVIVVREGDDSIGSFADLEGKTTAQSLTSNWYTLAEENGATIEAVEGWAQAVTLVEQGRVDATINDELTFLDYKKQTGAAGLVVAAATDDVSRSAFTFRSGSTTLADAVNEALAALAADGTLAEISAEFFGEDVSR
ncbi:amino acid ABC transporter substrate-binding protein [Cellulomonas carbonis]|uniref:Polar amino acid ABC transporter substrate-binding protein n=1 Tax=Cellulomonas carbonis T26 TaxID=947969 RepID=A0A0A0BSI5_9CELL|nr:amino acid ABC transporter substrate-binding protein [Cellulomonas carbonis]KGM10916.1 polar amino acid ABC transporter substrate-binding protein [Cellulomonas carbonis T26]GGC13026.1 amino acid ABC transporter substrate-binding protein [Cellulomonas carbonis]